MPVGHRSSHRPHPEHASTSFSTDPFLGGKPRHELPLDCLKRTAVLRFAAEPWGISVCCWAALEGRRGFGISKPGTRILRRRPPPPEARSSERQYQKKKELEPPPGTRDIVAWSFLRKFTHLLASS